MLIAGWWCGGVNLQPVSPRPPPPLSCMQVEQRACAHVRLRQYLREACEARPSPLLLHLALASEADRAWGGGGGGVHLHTLLERLVAGPKLSTSALVWLAYLRCVCVPDHVCVCV